MIVPSIGQAMSSSSMATVSAPVMRSGEAHIVPSTWQEIKSRRSVESLMVLSDGMVPD